MSTSRLGMIFREFSLILIPIILGIIAIVGVISGCFLGPDNPVEQIAEDVIKEETGINVDLSPEKEPEIKPDLSKPD